MKTIVLLVSLLFMSTAVFLGYINPVVAQETIYIRDDGRVEGTDKIQRDGDIYTFTGNIYDTIVVQRNNIVVDGAGYTLQGTKGGTGIFLSGQSNIAIQNIQIEYFDYGIYLDDSSNNKIYRNNITNNENGLLLNKSSKNIISENNMTSNNIALWLYKDSKNNIFSGNYVTNNDRGIYFLESSDNIIYHNDFVNNTKQVDDFWLSSRPGRLSENNWDDGYPSGGNYWSDYAGEDANGDGIGDTAYFIYQKNQDRYPLVPDLFPLSVSILSPENETYPVTVVPLIFTVSETTSWIGYSLDGQANVTITGNTTLTDLSDGKHSLIVYTGNILGNSVSSRIVYFTVDTSSPTIMILQPENKTYDANVVPLSFTVDESVSWMAYSLDGQTNVTIGKNTTLTLLDGLHCIVVYANDIVDNMGASGIVCFAVDSEAPGLSIISPTNTSYASSSILLSFVVYEPASWIGYSLDGQMNITISGNTTIHRLSDGIHTITVYANDTTGNVGSSGTIYFTVDAALPDTTFPTVSILSPENETYPVTVVPLIFTVSETTSWIGYSLDGQANVTITGNTTLTDLSDGKHSLIIYTRDLAENLGFSAMVYFTVDAALPDTPSSDTTFPTVSILSPANKTYDANVVPLTFTVDEPVSWMAYSLDGQTNVTITGYTVLSDLSEGLHTLIVYVLDTAGKTGISEIIHFTIESPQAGPTQLWIVAVIAVIAGVGFVFAGYLAYDLLKTIRGHA